MATRKKSKTKRAGHTRHTGVRWPRKTREIQNAVFDSTRWNDFRYRPDDIVIVTWGKTGTTWTQQIVGQIVCGAPDELWPVFDSPWLDMRIFPIHEVLGGLEAQTHRRFIKTHLPIDALVCSPSAKYIYVARDARDVVWSAYNHHASFTQEALDAFNHTPGLVGPPLGLPTMSVRDYYLYFLEHGGSLPGFLMDLWDHVQGWWDVRAAPNVLLVHFNSLKADLEGEVRRIARFLDVDVSGRQLAAIVEHCGFDYMRREFAKVDLLQKFFTGGGETFIHKGTNGRWKDVLSAAEAARCDEQAARYLTPECAHWLKTGQLPADAAANTSRARPKARPARRTVPRARSKTKATPKRATPAKARRVKRSRA
jgi:aryl sulfotransferase